MKAAEYRQMTEEELRRAIDELRQKQFQLRARKVTDVVENPAEFRRLRRDVARVLTILREKKAKAAAPAAPSPVKR